MFMRVVTHVTLRKASPAMLSKQEMLERAFRAIEGLKAKPTMAAQEHEPLQVERSATQLEGASCSHGFPRIFPHCPRCGSFYLYRKNNNGDYECQTCELGNITEDEVRSPRTA